MKKLGFSLAVALGLTGLAVPVDAGMSSIGTSAGCHVEFKNNKMMADACVNCVLKQKGRFKKGPKNAWSCGR